MDRRTLPQLAVDAHGKASLVRAALERVLTKEGLRKAESDAREAIADLELVVAAIPLASERLDREERLQRCARIRAAIRATDIRAARAREEAA